MARRNSKTIYLSNSRRRRSPKDKRVIVSMVIGLTAIVGAGVALLPNAYRITENGEVIGVVAKKEYIDTALETVEVQLEKQYKTEVKIDDIDEIKKVRSAKKDLIDPNKLPGFLRESLSIELEFQEFLIDGERVAIVESKESLDELKTQLKKKYFDDTNVRAEFASDVKLKPVFTTEDQLMPMEDLVDLCSKRQKKTVTYEVQPGDSLWGIANKLGCSIPDILKANEGMTDKTPLKIGQELKAEVRVPLLGLELIQLPKTEETKESGSN